MTILFSMDGVKLNTGENYTSIHSGQEDHLSNISSAKIGSRDYCKMVLADVIDKLNRSNWQIKNGLGSLGKFESEPFLLVTDHRAEYDVVFILSTYNEQPARLEIRIEAEYLCDGEYDLRLEEFKIALKNRLHKDWVSCTWIIDDQSTCLCKEAYEKASYIENKLRGFSSKVLIHYLGINWINRAGLEKYEQSVTSLKEKFIKRVPEFDDINTDFLSMTLETFFEVICEGIVYEDEVVLSRQEYVTFQNIAKKKNIPGENLANYLRERRTRYKNIWDDIFAPLFSSPETFKAAMHSFIENRNHVAHCKVLSKSSYQIMMNDFSTLESLIEAADNAYERTELSNEALSTAELFEAVYGYEQSVYREIIKDETGMEILDEIDINLFFDECLYKLYNEFYQRYHLDIEYEVSDYHSIGSNSYCFYVSCAAVEDRTVRVEIKAEYKIDDSYGADSDACIIACDGKQNEITQAVITFHNGDACENEDGVMTITDQTRHDISTLEEFKNVLYEKIDNMNPYPEILRVLEYESKGAEEFISDYPCDQCGRLSVSVNEKFLPIGRCYYCGYENEMDYCDRCGALVNEGNMIDGFCLSCYEYIERQ